MTTITERIAAATGATDITVRSSDAYDIPEDSCLLEMSSPDGVIALRCKLTQAGFDVLHLVKLPGNRARGRIVPPVDTPTQPAHTFAVGDAVEAARDIKWGLDAHVWRGTPGHIRNLEPDGKMWAVVFPSDDTCITCHSHELRPATADTDDALNPEPAEGGNVLPDDDEPMTWDAPPPNALMQRARAATGMAMEPNEDVLRKRVEQLEAALEAIASRTFVEVGKTEARIAIELNSRVWTTALFSERQGVAKLAREALKGAGE